jgi:hypothetical protein
MSKATTKKDDRGFVNLDEKTKDLKAVPGLYEFAMENCFIAGGAVRDSRRGVQPKDYDLFFRSDASRDEFIETFGKLMEITGIGNYNYNDFQFITLYTGSPLSVISKFDWNVNMMYHEFNNNKLYRSTYVPGELKLNVDCEKPLSAYLRLPDMINKGFKISKEELMFTLAFIGQRVNLKNLDNLDKEFEWVSAGGGMVGAGAARKAVERALEDAKHPRHSKLAKALK